VSEFARAIKHPSIEPETISLDPHRAVQTLAKATIPGLPFNVASVLDHKGLTQGLDTDGFAGKSIITLPEAAGGALARIVASVTKLRWEAVSPASLGELTPLITPGMERDMGREIG
jgi:hypothetical protein